MVKYLSGRQKRRPQDKLTPDRYQYLGLDQAEPNLADPATSPGVPAGAQFQLIAVSGYDGERFWVPVGGELQPGSITIFDEGSQVSGTSSITQLNFVGAAVTAVASVQSPSGHPGVAATVTVIPVTVGDNPPIGAGTTNNGELWWESDTGDLYVYYNDGDSSQWVMANSGGRGLTGDKGETGDKGIQGQKGELGTTGSQGDKGDKGDPSTVKGNTGDKGDTGQKGATGNKGDEGEKGATGDKGDMNVINSNADDRIITGTDTAGELNAESKLTFDSDNVTATLNVTGNTNITGITTINNNLFVNGDIDVDGHTNLDNVSIAGVTTFVGAIDANGGANIDNIQIGVTNDNEIDTFTGNLTIDSAGGTTTIDDNVVVSGNLNVTGVLTYEDVTNVDSVGLITARDGIFIPDDKKLEFGNAAGSGDLQISHTSSLANQNDSNGDSIVDGDTSFINENGTGSLIFKTNGGPGDGAYQFFDASWRPILKLFSGSNARVSLYHGGTEKFVTTDDGVKIIGGLQDKDGELGTSGQVLTSTGTQLNWVNSSSIGTDTNTTYDLSVASGTTKIRLTGSDSTDDDVEIVGSGSVTVTRNNANKLTISGTDTNTQVTINNNADNRIITGSNTANTLNAESNLTYDGSVLKINGTGQALLTLRTTDNASDRGIAFQNSGNSYVASINVEDAGSNAADLVFHVDDTQNTDLSLVEERLRIKTTGALGLNGANYGTSGQVLTSQGSGSAPTWTTPAVDNNTTYAISAVDGDNSDEEKIRLTASNPSSTDDIVLEAGTGLSIARTGDKITFTNTDTGSGTGNTSYDLSVLAGTTKIRLAGSDSTNDDVEIAGGTNVTVTRNNANKLTISSTDTNTDTNTTYDLVTSSSGSNVQLLLDASSGDDDPILITAGTNVSFSGVSATGFTINTSATLSGTIDQADKIKISTATGNEYKNITFVDRSATNASYNDLKIDSQDDQLAYNPSANRIKTTGIQLSRIYTTGASAGTSGQVLTSGGSSGNFSWVNASTIGGSVDTTYDLSVLAGTTKIRLAGSDSTNDDVEIAGGTGISVTRTNSGKLTITNTDTGSSSNANVTVSTGAPSSPSAGDLWWDSDDGDLLVYYNDGNTSQWVTTGSSGQKGDQGTNGTNGTDGTDGTDGDKGQKGQKGDPEVGVSNMQIFTSSGTWTKPSSGNMVNVYIWGGGAGGRNGSTARGGGGGGGYGEYRIPMSSLGSTVSVTIGAGGGQNSNGGNSQFGSSAYQAGGGNTGDQGSASSGTRGSGGSGGSPLGRGTGGSGGGYTVGYTDDNTSVYGNTSPPSQKDGHSGGGGGSAAGEGLSGGASAFMAGGGGGAWRQYTGSSSGGTSYGGGNGGNHGSNGTAPGGGGGSNGSGARGECWVVVV